MASELFGRRFRQGVGDLIGLADPNDPDALFSNEQIDDYGLQADEDYPRATFNAKVAYAVVKGLEALCAQYAAQVSYTQNASSESLGQAYDHYSDMLKKAQAKFETLLGKTDVAVMWGSTVVQPRRDEEFPDA